MDEFIELYNLLPGDRIVTPLFQTGLSTHHVIYIGKPWGLPLFAENRIYKGVQIVDATELVKTVKTIDRIIRFEGNEYQRLLAVQRACDLQGKSYNLLTYNCEHFANEVQTGRSYSSQISNAFLLASGFALVKFALSSKKIKSIKF